jgi:protoporphyrinogen oxidase
VNIGLAGDNLATGQPMHWIYFPEDTSIFHRISFPGSFSPWMVPEGCSSIQVEISESIHRPCDRGALVERTLQDLVTLGILKERDARPVSDGGRVRVAEVVTLDPAYIIYDLNHRENTQAIKNYLRQFGIVTRGRFGEWEYLNMDHAILRGKSAVEDALMVRAG